MIDGRGLFLRFEPIGEPAPLFVDVSKSGTDYPKDFRTEDARQRARSL